MNSPSPPPVPNASSIIGASETANNVNQSTPWANLNYTQGPNGQWTATQTTNPNVTSAWDTQLQNFNANPTAPNPSAAVGQAIGMENQYMQPWFQQQQSNLNSQLQNEGIAPGDAAAQNAQRDLQNNQTNWVGGNVAQFEPIAYQQSQQSWMDPLQAAAAVQGAANPGYVQTPQVDVTGAYNTQQNAAQYNYGQQVAQNAAMLGGLFSIPSAALGGWARNGFSLGANNPFTSRANA